MAVELRMPALSPTMEKGTLAKWLVAVGDTVRCGDLIAEIETDKATMELEADEEGRVASLIVAEGTDNVAVGTAIAVLVEEGEGACVVSVAQPASRPEPEVAAADTRIFAPAAPVARLAEGVRISPLAARIAEARGIDVQGIEGSGFNKRIVRADLGLPSIISPVIDRKAAVAVTPAPVAHHIPDVPHELAKLSNMRKTIARRLTESKQQVPHIYLTVDINIDPLLALRAELNGVLASRGIKLSVNDMVIKALALALIEVPQCNVQFAGDQLAHFKRSDISVAVSIPNGLITPVIVDAAAASLSAIATRMKELVARAREGKLQPHEYHGGTASLSNLGMFGIKQFEAVINPPQAMIMAVGVGERRPVVAGGEVKIGTVMTATGSFDHRAIDGADAAQLMQAFKRMIEQPIELLG